MLDIGWSEMLMIAAVAVVVIGPKELPRTLRTIGRWVAKARSLTREFQSNVDDMIAQSEIKELAKTSDPISNFNSENILEDITSSKINETEPRNSLLSKEQLDGASNSHVLDDKNGPADDRLGTSKPGKIIDNGYDQANKDQCGPTNKKVAAKATEN